MFVTPPRSRGTQNVDGCPAWIDGHNGGAPFASNGRLHPRDGATQSVPWASNGSAHFVLKPQPLS